MNWQSPMYICRTLDENINGSSADFADAVEEITDYALDNDLKAVINYSAGGGNNQTKEDACQYASDNGMLLVAATGNGNGMSVIWPAAYSNTITGVVAVGSTDDDDTVSNFSNIGPEVTVVAPGRDILSTTPTYQVQPNLSLNYDIMSGTSMAPPLVSGLAALMWSRHTGFTNQKIKECLQNTAVPLGSGEFDNSWGHGRVDALAALKCGDFTLPVTKLVGVCTPKTTIHPALRKPSSSVTASPKRRSVLQPNCSAAPQSFPCSVRTLLFEAVGLRLFALTQSRNSLPVTFLSQPLTAAHRRLVDVSSTPRTTYLKEFKPLRTKSKFSGRSAGTRVEKLPLKKPRDGSMSMTMERSTRFSSSWGSDL